VTSSFQIDSHVPKLQVATFDKWIFPLERNRPAHKSEPS
jgi:hypothetical protein